MHKYLLCRPQSCNPHNFDIESAVQYGNNQFGKIKWIGSISGTAQVYAGIEMVINCLHSLS